MSTQSPEAMGSPLPASSPPAILPTGSPLSPENPRPASSPPPQLFQFGHSCDTPEALFGLLCDLTRRNPTECDMRIQGLMGNQLLFNHFMRTVSEGSFNHLRAINYERLARTGQLESYEEARAYFTKAFETLDSTQMRTRASLRIAFTYAYEKKFDRCLAALEVIPLDSVPHSYFIHYNYYIAYSMIELNDERDPTPYLEALIAHPTEREEAINLQQEGRFLLARICAKRGDYQGAYQCAKGYLHRNSRLKKFRYISELCMYVARYYVSLNNYDQVERTVMQGLDFKEHAPAQIVTNLYFLGFKNHSELNNRPMIEPFAKALATTPHLKVTLGQVEYTEYLHYAAGYRLDANENAMALELLTELLSLNLIEYPIIFNNANALLAITHARLGNYSKAMTTFSFIAIEEIAIEATRLEAIKMYQKTCFETTAEHYTSQIEAWKLGGGIEGRMTTRFRIDLGHNLFILQVTYNQPSTETLIATLQIALEHNALDYLTTLMLEGGFYYPFLKALHSEVFNEYRGAHKEQVAKIDSDCIRQLIQKTVTDKTDPKWRKQLLLTSQIRLAPSIQEWALARTYYTLGWFERDAEVVNERECRRYFTLCTTPAYRQYLTEEQLTYASEFSNRL